VLKTSIGPSAKATSAQSSKGKTPPSAQLSASSFQPLLCEQFQEQRNAGSRPEAPFLKSLFDHNTIRRPAQDYWLAGTWPSKKRREKQNRI
jgi:hypothetical protein